MRPPLLRPAHLLLASLLIAALPSVTPFNLDTDNYVRYRGEPGSMFGFSVAQHRESGMSWVLVGAPAAQTGQPGVLRGGAVFGCDTSQDSCQFLPFDVTGNNNNSEGRQIDLKSGQWFGATIRSSGEDGVVLACAPRYVSYSAELVRRDPVGTCYVAKNRFTSVAEYSPCRTRNWGHHRQGSCQAGLGASVSKDGKRLYVGAVGSWYWQGQLHSVDEAARLPYMPPKLYMSITPGQVISQSLHSRPDVISTNEGPTRDDDSYLGYSVATGDFSDDVEPHDDVAVGMPRGEGLLGKVILFTWNTTILQNITGQQLGAYFGYSICVGDIDGDEKDDLIIGAPLYTDLNNNLGHYETGRVYILYQGKMKYKFHQVHTRDGKNSKARFGLALTSLGDINKDGFGDFAVGAPYDGPEERGAVYIYHGSKFGARKDPSQIVYAEDVVGKPTTFGFSLSGGIDLDENSYPDVVIGAYEADSAVYLRARPVVKIDALVAFLGGSKQISLDQKNCTLKDTKTRVPCLMLNTCLQYSGVGVERRLDFDVQFTLDVKKPKSPRMFFLSDEGRNIMNQSLRLDKEKRFCKTMYVYIKPNVRDKLTSLEVEMKYGLAGTQQSSTRRTSRSLTPILDMNEELFRKDSVSIQKNCGKDNICIPDLRLIASPSVDRYLLGSSERLNIDVIVQNEGEDAFEAMFELQVPPGLNYVKIERLDDAEREIPVQCSAPAFINNNTLRCDIGNPLPKEKLVHFNVILQPYHQDGMKPRYEFYMSVNSTNPENKTTASDNLGHLSVPIWVETDLILDGMSQPSDVHYNLSLYKTDNITHESEIGPQVSHVYSIRNKGPSNIVEAEALFLWPSYTLAGDHLLYLLEQPKTSGHVKCEVVEEVNVENLILEKRKYFLDSQDFDGVHSGLTSSIVSDGGNKLNVDEAYYSSSSSSSTSRSSGGHRGMFWGKSWDSLTAEEKKRVEEERKREEEEAKLETGDGSERQRKRLKEKEKGTHYTSNGGKLESHSHSSPVHVTPIYERGRTEYSESTPLQGRRTEERRFETSRSEWRSSSGGGIQGSYRPETEKPYTPERGREGQSRSYYEERHQSSNTSWSSGSPSITRTSTSWKVNKDGSETRGSHSNVEIGKTVNLADLGISSSSSDQLYGISDGGLSRASEHTEEKHLERNSSWVSTNEGKTASSDSSNWSLTRNEAGGRGSSTTGRDLHIAGGRDQSYGVSSHGTSGSRTPIDVNERSYFEDRHHKDSRLSSGFINERGSAQDARSRASDTSSSSSSHYTPTVSGWEQGSGRRRISDGSTGRNKTYSEERNIERNVTWSTADGKPITSEFSSWRVDENGNVRNGSHSTMYEGADESRNHFGSSRNGNLGFSGNAGERTKVFSEERHRSYNTSWSSGGGKPITHSSSSWKVNEGGIVRNGSSSNVYEGTAPPFRSTNVEEGRRHFESSYGTSRSSGGTYGSSRSSSANSYDKSMDESEANFGTSRGVSGGSYETSRSNSAGTHGTSRGTSGSSFETSRSSSDMGHETSRSSSSRSHGTSRDSSGTSYETSRSTSGNRQSTPRGASAGSYETTRTSDGSYGTSRSTSGGSYDTSHGASSVNYDSSETERRNYGSRTSSNSRNSESRDGSESKNTGLGDQERSFERGRHSSSHGAGLHSQQSERRSSGHVATNINLGDLLGKGNEDGFQSLGSIARGPGDGVARTHSFNVELDSDKDGTSVDSRNRHSSSESQHRTRQYSSNVGQDLSETEDNAGRRFSIRGGSGGFSARHNNGEVNLDEQSSSGYSSTQGGRSSTGSSRHYSSSHHQSWGGQSSSGGHSGTAGSSSGSRSRSWSYGSVSGTADGDNIEIGGAYSPRELQSGYNFQPRHRRQIEGGNEDLDTSLNCGPTRCIRIKCRVGPLEKDEEAFVEFKSRVWVQTIRKFSKSQEVGVSSLVGAKVSLLPHIGAPDIATLHSKEIHTQIIPRETTSKPDVVPLWVVVLSACAGAIILMLLVYILYKVGFFKRNRPSDAPEKQPLNRNGHYQNGDEAL